MKYKQCRLKRGTSETTSWIPEKYAVPGKTLKLKEGNVWVDGWTVEWASEESRPEELLPDYHAEIKGHRKATGDVR